MKTFTMSEVLSWKLDPNRSNPKPFPGLYPTRWLVMARYNSGRESPSAPTPKDKIFTYFGKPNYAVAMRLRELTRHHFGTLWFGEFDRGGLIKQGVSNLPRDLSAVPCEGAPNLCSLYYFVNPRADRAIQNWPAGGWRYRKLIKYKNHRVMCYDNQEAPWDAAVLAGGKKWLINTKFEW